MPSSVATAHPIRRGLKKVTVRQTTKLTAGCAGVASHALEADRVVAVLVGMQL